MTDGIRHTIFNAYHLNGELTTLLVALVEGQTLFMGENYSFVKSPGRILPITLFLFQLPITL